MARITVSLTGLDISRRALQRIADAVGGSRALMQDIGESVLTSTRHRFQSQRDPDGRRWKPSRRAVRQGGQTLVDTGRLRDSITLRVTDATATIGTNLVYAAIHQFGGKRRPMPARPYLGLDADDREEIGEIVKDHVMRAVTGR